MSYDKFYHMVSGKVKETSPVKCYCTAFEQCQKRGHYRTPLLIHAPLLHHYILSIERRFIPQVLFLV